MELDYEAVLHSLPTPFVLLTPDLVVITANEAYTALAGRTAEQLVGRSLLDAFPENPAQDGAVSIDFVSASIRQVVKTLRPQSVPLRRYDLQDPDTGEWVPRYWTASTSPVLDGDGQLVALLHRPEEVTSFLRERLLEQDGAGGQYISVQRAQAELDHQGNTMRSEWAAETVVTKRLAALADVALRLARSESIDELITMITEVGLSALGAVGGAVAVLGDDGLLHSTLTAALGGDTQQKYGVLPLEGPLPASKASATGQRVLLPDLAASLAYCPDMAAVVEMTGCVAWASIPLRGAIETIGALTVGWGQPHEFSATEVDILDVLAAQSSHAIARLKDRAAERQVAAQVARMAETLQRSLLAEPVAPAHTEVAVRYRPAARQAQVGGDWYDAFPTADGATFLVVGDVAGHDQNAAAAMGQVRNLLRGVAYAQPGTPSSVLTMLDWAMLDLDVDVLATAVLARLTPAEGGAELQWSSAGHVPAVLCSGGEATLLEAKSDLLLGLDPDSPRHDEARFVPQDAVVLLYTDGLVERRGSSLDDGIDWLLRTVTGLAGQGPDQICDALLALVGDHAEDDIALLALRVT